MLPSCLHRSRRATYTRGTEVRLLIKDLELSKTFLGYDREMTLMEADAVLLGVHKASDDAPDQDASNISKDLQS